MSPKFQQMSWNRMISLAMFLLLLVFGSFWLTRTPQQSTDPTSIEREPLSQSDGSVAAIFSDQSSPGESVPVPKAIATISGELKDLIEEVSQEKPVWRKALDNLMEIGRAGSDPTEAIVALLSAEPGMGDRLLALILELEGSQDQQDALLVALATALTLDPGVVGTDSWPEGLQSLWHDRAGTILWMAELWIDGHPKSHYFPRFLQMENVLEPWHSVELAALLEDDSVQLDEVGRSRLQQMLRHSLQGLEEDSVVIARQWLQSEDPTLREVALDIVGRSLASDPQAVSDWVETVRYEDQIAVLESVLDQVEGDQLVEMIDTNADWMLQQEYRGSALLNSFSRGRDLDLEQVVYLRGNSPDSERFRNLILYASQGGIGRGDQIPPLWSQGLQRIAQTDPALSVRCMALRICAMSWPHGDHKGFRQLIQRSDVDPRTAEIAHALMLARQTTR
ncbi:MAG: hypothetical protein VX764_06390 [Planctomycetota bacterium]|nr:hypothetical protein [Planctomycetota bacterium]